MRMKRQQGVALLMSLVILLVLSLLAISGMQGSIMQERMASAQLDGFMALEVAETALGEVEDKLDGMSDLDGFGSSAGLYESDSGPDPYDNTTWETDASAAATSVDGITPRYFVEHMGTVVLDEEGQLPRDQGQYGENDQVKMDYVRIVVMAAGPSGQSRRLIESYYVFKPSGLEGVGEGG
ncbi:pilus assembly PilX family protein [Marinobacter mangrovi]|uniref:pilus assembly PilX family protein n=1 Tax=Marinobacter mangrovi TaxID=2803918 RepID=UPI001932A8EC|nr:PilX N-terminal domain-containing pilus assembly protein [Marinobacter mangrovi]